MTAKRQGAKEYHPAEDVIEDVEWIVKVGGEIDLARIAARIGMTAAGIEKVLYRASRPDLLAKLIKS